MKYRFTLLFIAFSFYCLTVRGTTEEGRRSVGVVLSGGGAKGVAHISVLKVIEEAGIPIDYITGTSMGAIIGGLYAIGYDTHTLDSMVRSQNWTDLLSDKIQRRNLSFSEKESSERYILSVPLTQQKKFVLPSGLVSGNNVYNLITELSIDYHDSISFTTLPIPFSCVAYDLVSGKAVTLDNGFLPTAIRASMSIPGAFEPVHTDGMVLIDGGIANNFPVDVAKKMGADIIIGVDVTSGPRDEDDINTLADMFNQITYFTGEEMYEKNMPLVDLYIKPDITGYGAGSFNAEAIDSLLLRGETAALCKFDELIALRDVIGLPEGYRPAEREPVELDKEVPVRNIVFEGLQYQKEKPLRKIIGIKEDSEVRPSEIQNAVARLQGNGTISEVKYRLEGHAPYDLVFMVRESTRNSISVGLRFDTEEMAALLLNVKLAANQMSNSHFDITARLSENPYVKGSYILGNETQRTMTLSYMYKYNNLDLYDCGKKLSNLDFNLHSLELDFANIRINNFKVGLGARYEFFGMKSALSLRDMETNARSEGLFSYYATTQIESYDRRYNPTKGMSLQAGYTFYTSNLVNYHGNPPFSAIHLNFNAALSVGKRVAFLPGIFGRVLIGSNVAFPASNLMGGTVAGRYLRQQIPFIGVHHFENFDNTVIGARLDFRVKLGGSRQYVSLKSNYAKENDDFFDILKGRDIFGIGAGYSYNTIIGPIDFILDWSNCTKKVGVYLNLGYYF